MAPSTSKNVMLFLVMLVSLNVFGQHPPAQGPPAVSGNNIQEFPVSILIPITSVIIDSILLETNHKIKEQDPAVDITITLSSVKLKKPYLSETKYIDHPNQKIIIIPLKVNYELKINHFSNRHLLQNIEITIFCKDWFTSAGGVLNAWVDAEKPYLVGPPLTEQLINTLLFNFITPFIDNKIRINLPSRIQKIISLQGLQTRCNCLSVFADTAPDYKFAAIQYQYKQPPYQVPTPSNSIRVSVKSIKRLKAKDDIGRILYDSVENIDIDFFANQQGQIFSVDNLREEQEIILPDNSMLIKKPENNGTVVLIASIKQRNSKRDSKFVLYTASDNFGDGLRKLIVNKVYISRPHRLPNGQMSKPRDVSVKAYELTIDIIGKLILH